MPNLKDINLGAIDDGDVNKKFERLVAQLNEWGRQISNEERTKIINDDAGTPRLLLGYQQDGFSNGNVGIKLSQEGQSVLSAGDSQLALSSDFNSFKIVQTGTVEVPFAADGETQVVSVNHSIGYAPIVIGFLQGGGFSLPLPYLLISSSGAEEGKVLQRVYCYSDTTKVYFSNQSNLQGTAGGTIKYYILQETAS